MIKSRIELSEKMSIVYKHFIKCYIYLAIEAYFALRYGNLHETN